MQRHEEVLAAQERALAEVWAELGAAAAALSERRATAARALAAAGAARDPHARDGARDVRRRRRRAAADAVGARGLDRVEFRLSANPGEEARPLARVASGGELSRTMLALKRRAGRPTASPTMVFDEVDAGVGGRASPASSRDKLAAAARGRQVLCVTHLAPIAARAAPAPARGQDACVPGVRAWRAMALDGERARRARWPGCWAATRRPRRRSRHARELLGRRNAADALDRPGIMVAA